jgi:streptogramin lyase
MAIAAGKIWAGDPLDPVTLRPTAHLKTTAADVVSGAGSVWYVDSDHGLVKRVDPVTDEVIRSYSAGEPGSEENFGVFAVGALWVYSGGNRLWRIDPSTNRVTTRVLDGLDANAQGTFDVGDGGVWVPPFGGDLFRYDLRTFARRTYPADNASSGFVLVAFGSVWESNLERETVWRVRE